MLCKSNSCTACYGKCAVIVPCVCRVKIISSNAIYLAVKKIEGAGHITVSEHIRISINRQFFVINRKILTFVIFDKILLFAVEVRENISVIVYLDYICIKGEEPTVGACVGASELYREKTSTESDVGV